MNNKIDRMWIAALAALVSAGALAQTHPTRVHVVHEPRLVPTVSSKTEKAWAHCRMCDGRISYERTFRRDPYANSWNETTKSVPEYCRSCAPKQKRLEKLRREEENLDRKIEEREREARLAAKRRYLRDMAGTH
ncbi:MAG: hypothetical protein ACI4R9_00390 [Kiritimatiellia bacterium]